MMTKFTLLGVAANLSTAIATTSLAQAAIQEMGAYASYHQDGNLENCTYTNSATRNDCCRSRDSGRDGISTICPFIKERTRNYNQTLVGAGRPPPAARSRYSHVHVCISAKP